MQVSPDPAGTPDSRPAVGKIFFFFFPKPKRQKKKPSAKRGGPVPFLNGGPPAPPPAIPPLRKNLFNKKKIKKKPPKPFPRKTGKVFFGPPGWGFRNFFPEDRPLNAERGNPGFFFSEKEHRPPCCFFFFAFFLSQVPPFPFSLGAGGGPPPPPPFPPRKPGPPRTKTKLLSARPKQKKSRFPPPPPPSKESRPPPQRAPPPRTKGPPPPAGPPFFFLKKTDGKRVFFLFVFFFFLFSRPPIRFVVFCFFFGFEAVFSVLAKPPMETPRGGSSPEKEKIGPFVGVPDKRNSFESPVARAVKPGMSPGVGLTAPWGKSENGFANTVKAGPPPEGPNNRIGRPGPPPTHRFLEAPAPVVAPCPPGGPPLFFPRGPPRHTKTLTN